MDKTTFHEEHLSETSTEDKNSSLEATAENLMTLGGNTSHMPFQLTSHRLNGKNYLEWTQSVKLVIDRHGKLGHLTGETKKPEVGDPKMNSWRLENSLVIAWLINSMEPVIVKNGENKNKKPRCDHCKNIGTPVKRVGRFMGNQ
ncbi:uncharacterized protein LOC107007297 isoform X2 [Solanum pennellii]|uniref:Uncharacterized protein LOC107007297 isoform X2 n=1 Tax=Solanum pennellii TaxID=28526 RepID=A0ABM1FT54_SOLPN|nr:uncharacterized protein LOC107007297 isoform X2 [Solanum pennellii]